jgi:hypothetical protein
VAPDVIWRGIRARRLLSLTIFTLTALVVSGTVVSLAFSRLTNVSRGSAGAVVLLGFVALTSQSVESVRRREAELALARLRGRRGLRLLVFAVAEPCVVVILGAAAGLAAGWFATRLVVAAWLPGEATVTLGGGEWAGAALVTVGALVLVVAASWRLLRTPLLEQLAAAGRPGSASTVGLFMQLVLVLGAVVSIYQADRASSSRVDWVTLLSPAVVGLAGAQILIWLVLAVLAWVVPRSRGARVGWFLTLRRLLRRGDSLAVIRIVVAAGVVFGVASSASTAAQNWREDRARLQVGAPVSYPVAAGALRAYAAAVRADPQGRWLLPAVSYTSSSQGSERRIFVASDRWRSVVGDFYAGTPAAGVSGGLDSLATTPPVRIVTGDQVSATVVSSSLTRTRGLSITFDYVDDAGDTAVATVPLRQDGGHPAGPGLVRFTGKVLGCHFACSVSEIGVAGMVQVPGRPRQPLRLVDATFAGQGMLGAGTGIRLVPGQPGLSVVRDGATLVIMRSTLALSDSWTLGTFRTTGPQPALSTGGFTPELGQAGPAVLGVDGTSRRISLVAKEPVLPFVGTSGSLLDLGEALVGAGGSIPDTHAMVLARADTPPAIIAALRASHSVGRPTTYDKTLHRLDQTPRAQGTRLYVVVAGFSGLLALVAIVSTLAQQTRERRREAASLRSVGFKARAIAGAYRREAVVLAVTTFVGTTVGAWTACHVLLPALPLVSGWEFAPPMDAAPHISFIAASALVAGGVVGIATFVAFRGVGRGSPPRILREDPS